MLFNALSSLTFNKPAESFKQIVKGIVPELFLNVRIVPDRDKKEGLSAWNARHRNGVVFTFR
jgi:hypothetical protein